MFCPSQMNYSLFFCCFFLCEGDFIHFPKYLFYFFYFFHLKTSFQFDNLHCYILQHILLKHLSNLLCFLQYHILHKGFFTINIYIKYKATASKIVLSPLLYWFFRIHIFLFHNFLILYLRTNHFLYLQNNHQMLLILHCELLLEHFYSLLFLIHLKSYIFF